MSATDADGVRACGARVEFPHEPRVSATCVLPVGHTESHTNLYRPTLTDAGVLARCRTFSVYRRGDLSATHNADQVLPADVPQFEGVVFSDGHCVVRWMTLSHSTAVWPSFDELWRIHGHDAPDQPHGTVIVWHDAYELLEDPTP